MNNEILSHSMVHYLLTIHKLKESKGYARITDIAKELELTKGSVSTSINNLKKKEFVKEEGESKFLILTESGHKQVHRILSTRTLMYYFLKDFVGVSNNIAVNDSCKIEHLFSEETEKKLFDFMKTLACCCEEKKVFNFNTTLDLCQFENQQDFIESQIGDSHLSDIGD